MATETQSFVEQVKEMRAMRIQQLRQMNAEQRFQASMINYQRSMLRSNEKLITSISNLGNKITSTITGLVGAIGKAGKATVGAAAGGVVSLSDSIVSGLAKALPYALIGLVGKIMIWDNMSSESKSRLTSSFGRLFGKLFSGVENMFDGLMAGVFKTIESIKKGFKELNIKFPFFETLFKKAGIVFEIITEGLKVVTAYIEKLVDFVKENPIKSGVLGAATLLSPQIVSVLGAAVSGVLSYVVARGLLNKHMATLLSQAGIKTGVASSAERALMERVGAQGLGTISQRMGVDLSKEVFMGEGGKPIVGPDGKPILRTTVNPEAIGKTKMGTARAIAKRGFNFASRALGVVAAVELLIDPSELGGGFEAFEMELKGITNSPKQGRINFYERNKNNNAFIAFYSIVRDAASEKQKSGGLMVGDVLVVTDKYVYRARGTNDQKPLDPSTGISGYSVTTDNGPLDFVEVIAVPRSQYEKELEDLISDLEKKNQKNKDDLESELRPREGVTSKPSLSTSGTNIAGLAAIVQKYESAPAGYNQLFLKRDGKPYIETSKPITEMTVAEIREVQARQVEETKKAGIGKDPKTGKIRGTGAIGKYQFTETTLAGLLKGLGIKEDAIFDEALQDKLFVKLIGDEYLLYLKGRRTKEQFMNTLQTTWEGFRGPKAVTELNTFLDEVKKEYKGEDTLITQGAVVVNEKGEVVKGADLVIKRGTERIVELTKKLEGMESLADKPLMTMDGQNVVEVVKQKAIDYYEERKKAIKERMMENEPETLKSQLLDTLKITRDLMDVRNAKDGMDVPHSTVINNTTNNNSSGGSSGKNVRADGLRDTEFKTITGVFP